MTFDLSSQFEQLSRNIEYAKQNVNQFPVEYFNYIIIWWFPHCARVGLALKHPLHDDIETATQSYRGGYRRLSVG